MDEHQGRSVVGVYDKMDAAEAAVHRLDEEEFPIEQVSVVAQDLHSEREVHGYVTAGDVAKTGAVVGAWSGGLSGVLVGAAFLWVPGFGPLLAAGSFAAALLGGIEGALAGGAGGLVLGALTSWGVSERHILKYEEHLRGGKYLLIVQGNGEQVERAHRILARTRNAELEKHPGEASSSEPADRAGTK